MESGILVQPLVNGKIHGFAVQAENFSLSFRITNQTNSPSEEFTINGLLMRSADGQDISENFNNETFLVERINPHSSKVIDLGDTGQFMSGLTEIGFFVTPTNIANQISFLQKNPFSQKTTDISKTIGSNRWVDFFYIKSYSEYRQELSTQSITRLTWAAVILSLIQVLFVIFK